MDKVRCPNCRRRRSASDDPCPFCNWLPLRSTEMAFVEDCVVCPKCSAKRSATEPNCARCGAAQVLESQSENTLNFNLSSMFLVTTVVAVCVAITRVVPFLGISAFIVVGLSGYRTMLLIRERKRFRYPVAMGDVWQLMMASFVCILASVAVFVGTGFLGGIFLIAMIEPFGRTSWGALIVAAVYLGGTHGILGVHTCRKSINWPTFAGGAITGLIVGISTIVIVLNFEIVESLVLASVATTFAGGLWLASRRGGNRSVRPYLIGHSSAMVGIGFVAVSQTFGQYYGIVEFFLLWSAMLIPTLLSVLVLEKLWSWDDAFPRTLSHERPFRPMPRYVPPTISIEEEEGIKFE